MHAPTPTVPSFGSLYRDFAAELADTFPELAPALAQARALDGPTAQARFATAVRPHLLAIAAREGASLFGAPTAPGLEVLPGVRLTPSLWATASPATQGAVWTYVASLSVLARAPAPPSGPEEQEAAKMEAELRGVVDSLGEAMKGDAFKGMFEKLKEAMGAAAAATGGEEGAGAAPGAAAGGMPKLPERLFRGHIARMAEELAAEFRPEDFGIPPEMLSAAPEDPARVFEYLQELFTRRPEMLMQVAQRIAAKIQAKFARGEIKREDLLNEAQDLMREFSGNEAFGALFGNLTEMLQSTAKETGNEGSERRRTVQERLRAKLAAKQAAAAGGGVAGAGAGAGAGQQGKSARGGRKH